MARRCRVHRVEEHEEPALTVIAGLSGACGPTHRTALGCGTKALDPSAVPLNCINACLSFPCYSLSGRATREVEQQRGERLSTVRMR